MYVFQSQDFMIFLTFKNVCGLIFKEGKWSFLFESILLFFWIEIKSKKRALIVSLDSEISNRHLNMELCVSENNLVLMSQSKSRSKVEVKSQKEWLYSAVLFQNSILYCDKVEFISSLLYVWYIRFLQSNTFLIEMLFNFFSEWTIKYSIH